MIRHLQTPCPPLIPRSFVTSDPRFTGLLARPTKAFYALDFNAGGFDPATGKRTIHWIVGGGTRAAIVRNVLANPQNEVAGSAKLLRRLLIFQVNVQLYRMPLFPAGGPFGSHTVAIAHRNGIWGFASVHGEDHGDASVALAVAMVLPDRA
jgi:hypothetical protein